MVEAVAREMGRHGRRAAIVDGDPDAAVVRAAWRRLAWRRLADALDRVHWRLARVRAYCRRRQYVCWRCRDTGRIVLLRGAIVDCQCGQS